jgi:uncharacterized repeat protein (TIGR03806 family)
MGPTYKHRVLLFLGFVMAVFFSCREEDPGPIPPMPAPGGSPVVFDPAAVPYQTLSEYNFFQGAMADLVPVQGVLPYSVITPLFSDYAKKARFVWMMPGVKATYVDDHSLLDFPDGSVLIKNFYYDRVQPQDARRIVETRILYKLNGEWSFAEYVWNTEQTEAYLDLNGSTTAITWIDANDVTRQVDFRIPSGAECLTCHKKDSRAIPIGPKPQHLKMTYAYADGAMDQLDKWEQVGYLAAGAPANIESTVRWDDQSADLNDRVRSYLDMNCAHCHAEGSHCDYRPMRFAFSETVDAVNMGVCVPPEDVLLPALTNIVTSGNPGRSMMHYRLASTDESVRMPLLGRTLVHEEGLALITAWIESLDPPCN